MKWYRKEEEKKDPKLPIEFPSRKIPTKIFDIFNYLAHSIRLADKQRSLTTYKDF